MPMARSLVTPAALALARIWREVGVVVEVAVGVDEH